MQNKQDHGVGARYNHWNVPRGFLVSVIALLPSVLALGTVAMAAAILTFTRPLRPGATHNDAARALAFTTLCQAVHFGEETLTGFHEAFPALFGLPAIPLTAFVTFNVVWLAIWSASVFGLRAARSPALFAAWFLAIAGVLNGLAHPLMALAVGGYFPGLITSPAIGLLGLWLGIRLRQASAPRTQPGKL